MHFRQPIRSTNALLQADRTRAIYELAIQQPVLDMPEALWKVRPASLVNLMAVHLLAFANMVDGVVNLPRFS